MKHHMELIHALQFLLDIHKRNIYTISTMACVSKSFRDQGKDSSVEFSYFFSNMISIFGRLYWLCNIPQLKTTHSTPIPNVEYTAVRALCHHHWRTIWLARRGLSEKKRKLLFFKKKKKASCTHTFFTLRKTSHSVTEYTELIESKCKILLRNNYLSPHFTNVSPLPAKLKLWLTSVLNLCSRLL